MKNKDQSDESRLDYQLKQTRAVDNQSKIIKRYASIFIWFQQPELCSKIHQLIFGQSFRESLQLQKIPRTRVGTTTENIILSL